jgi:DNA-binding response OmpR family regulator
MLSKVLLVEDDVALRGVLAAALRRHGMRVAETGTAAEALADLRYERPDLILLDVHLPDGSGWDVAAASRGADPPVVTVAMSGQPVSPTELRERRVGAFLRKPFAIEELLRVVDARSAGGDEGSAIEPPSSVMHIRACAQTLALMPELGSASVDGPIADHPGEVALLRAVAQAAAEKYGLEVEADVEPGYMSIPFTHPDAPPSSPPRMGRVERWLRDALGWT